MLNKEGEISPQLPNQETDSKDLLRRVGSFARYLKERVKDFWVPGRDIQNTAWKGSIDTIYVQRLEYLAEGVEMDEQLTRELQEEEDGYSRSLSERAINYTSPFAKRLKSN